ncbi:hypothetical protein ASPCADRAFT_207831 [Aspergillus carbonarius ITEM 5010]|uniref:Uncharacterized protein n=1 Tax=Aspergillus carbonarius (strain ITEM 5010) TaxID=602072 RepID=A0A1R3RLL9_ASPC5|nr:hypothetical protein ASPCADRAFT_207831 [Aspergillus carbonarius ITEM 5010]
MLNGHIFGGSIRARVRFRNLLKRTHFINSGLQIPSSRSRFPHLEDSPATLGDSLGLPAVTVGSSALGRISAYVCLHYFGRAPWSPSTYRGS